MKTLTKTTLTTTALAIALPIGAWAQLSVGDNAGMTDAEIRAKFEAAGYTVSDIEREDGEIEVEYLSDGQEFEAEIDPSTGLIVEIETEDDEDEDDDEDKDDA